MFSFTHLLIDTLVIVDDKQGANLTFAIRGCATLPQTLAKPVKNYS
jgi:hypothetical protein